MTAPVPVDVRQPSFAGAGACERTDPHDHDDPRLPEYFHEWLRGRRRQAPELRSWKSQQALEYPAGSSAGLNGRRSDREDEAA